MYDNQQYNGTIFQQEKSQGNLPLEQQFGGGIVPQYQQPIPQQTPQVEQYQHVQQYQQPVPQQAPQPAQHVTNGVQLITEQQAQQIIETIKPTPLGNPVKVDKPAYLVTEEQMRYILSLAEGNPLQIQSGATFGDKKVVPQLPTSSKKNSIDTLGEMTLGTVSRLGHTFTGLVNSVVDVLTLGYGKQNQR